VAWRNVTVGQFNPALSLGVLAVPVIGGLGSVSGAIAGAVLLYAPTYFLSGSVSSIFGEFGRQVGFQLAIGGLSLVVILLNYPRGVAGATQTAVERILERVARRVDSRRPPEVHPPLEVSGVSLSFGGLRVLDDVGLRVAEGEIVGLIGGNGAGKTTLLNVISGVLRPSEGSVRVFGTELVALGPEFRPSFGLARSFQNARLFPGLTVVESVQVALARQWRVSTFAAAVGAPWVRSLDRRTRAEAEAIVERLGLSPWADSLASDLSTGTRRICDLAMQVAAGPKLLLLDEPTAGVAQRECEMFPPLLRRIRDELGCAIVIVEHDMPMLMSLCYRVYALEAGRVIAEGAPAEVRDNPQVIASYLGTDATAINRSGAGPARRRRTEAIKAKELV
jgi:ABC-type branched-subunit amino acid transport system ATPase component